MNGQILGRPHTRAEQRKGNRFRVVVPIEAMWKDASGNSVTESAEALEVNGQGGLLEMKRYPGPGAQIAIKNLVSGEEAQARVAAIRRAKDGTVLGVAVELLQPSETFWGVNFQLKKTSAQLAKIEEAIKSGGVDPRILRDFRDAVDYVRKTAWAVQEWQERQLKQHDPQTVLPLIISERIRRATQLSHSISADLATHDVTHETSGLKEFFRAIEGLYIQIGSLFRGHRA
ncbi:MAG TPA: hypothetical protein VNK23_00015 [Candidatus Dormibacteraeota bacterium]|nr:hypothetical protein [Candidatus Dormibacteraeota bacterium]